MADDLRQWLDGDATTPDPPATGTDGDPPRHRRRARVVALMCAMLALWLVAAALIVAGRDGPARPASGSPTPSAAAPMTAARPDESGATPTPAATAPDRPAATGVADDPLATPPPAGVAPTAVRLVREAVTRADGPATSAVDVAAAEHPHAVADGAWLVRVHAVVLHGDRRRWRRSTHDVWAVPVGQRAGRLVGLERPWRVATVDGRVVRTAWRAATVDPTTVRAALRRAGMRPPAERAGLTVERHPTDPTIVRASVGDDVAVWLRQGATLEVLGAPSPAGSS